MDETSDNQKVSRFNFSTVAAVKLLTSLQHLEVAIYQARSKIDQDQCNNQPERHSVLSDRLNQYLELVGKNRTMAFGLIANLEKQNWDEVYRIINIVQSTSLMIQQDVLALLGANTLQADH